MGNSAAPGASEKSLFEARIENLLEPRRIREIGRFRKLRDPGDSGDWGKSLYLADVGNAVGANTWGAGELGNWGLGGFRRLEDPGDWDVREMERCGRFGRFGKLGDSEIRESRKFGRFGRLGVSGDREIREIGGNHYTWKKIRTSWNPGRLERFGRLGRLGRFGRFGGLGDSGDSGDLRHSGNSGDWGKSLYVAKLENPLEPQRIREIGRFGSLRDSGDSGNWKIREFAGLEDSEDSGGWEIRSFGRLGNSGNWEKSSYVAGVGHASRGEHLESRRVGKLGAWEIRKIGRFGRLGCPGDSGG